LIINENKDAVKELKKRREERAKRPMTYMEKQYARANAKANKIKNHNELMLKQLKENNNG
tara:strand:+ start:311 stop:490 length:180 start_codon:yes stop_codon:yes gene_type:complete